MQFDLRPFSIEAGEHRHQHRGGHIIERRDFQRADLLAVFTEQRTIDVSPPDETGAYHIELTHNHDGRDYEPGTQFGHLAFHVAELEPVVAEVERRGWWYRRSKPEASSKYIFVKDPDGYDIEILTKR